MVTDILSSSAERWRARLQFVLPFGVGAATAIGFEPLALWPLTLAGLVWLLREVAGASGARGAFGLAWRFGVGHFVVGLNWIATAFTYQAAMPVWLGVAAVVVVSLYLALFPALAALVAWHVGRPRDRGAAFVLAFAGAWILGECLRATLFTGFSWNPLGVVLLPLPALAHAASWMGSYGLSGVVLLLAGVAWLAVGRRFVGALALVGVVAIAPLVAWLGDRMTATDAIADSAAAGPHASAAAAADPTTDAAAGAAATTDPAAGAAATTDPAAGAAATTDAAAGAAPTTGAAAGAAATTAAASGRGIPIRIVQPNIHQDEKYVPDLAAKHAKIYAKLSGPPTSQPRLLLWPEAATLRFLQLEPDAREELATLLGPQDTLVLGGEAVILDPAGHAPDIYYNSVFALDHTARLLWRYDKAHLVPFGEYLPLRPVLEKIGLSKLVPGEGDFSSGPGPRTFEVPGFGTLGLQVCYEIIFSGRVLDGAHRPSFLFNPSNDAWFGKWGPPQHFAQARLRAIEEGVPIVRATPTGISGVIAPDGSIVSALPQNVAGVLDAVIPPPRPATWFAKTGLWMSPLIGILLIAASWRVARRAR
jgi:apolipoprotein N-acyltransferase